MSNTGPFSQFAFDNLLGAVVVAFAMGLLYLFLRSKEPDKKPEVKPADVPPEPLEKVFSGPAPRPFPRIRDHDVAPRHPRSSPRQPALTKTAAKPLPDPLNPAGQGFTENDLDEALSLRTLALASVVLAGSEPPKHPAKEGAGGHAPAAEHHKPADHAPVHHVDHTVHHHDHGNSVVHDHGSSIVHDHGSGMHDIAHHISSPIDFGGGGGGGGFGGVFGS